MISSPGDSSIAAYAQCRAAVPEETETHGAPTIFSKFISNSSTNGPVVNQSLLSAAVTLRTSSSAIDCLPYGIMN